MLLPGVIQSTVAIAATWMMELRQSNFGNTSKTQDQNMKKNKGAKSKSLSFLLWLPDFDLRYS